MSAIPSKSTGACRIGGAAGQGLARSAPPSPKKVPKAHAFLQLKIGQVNLFLIRRPCQFKGVIMSNTNEGLVRIFDAVFQLSGSDEIVTFQTAAIFFLAFVVMMASMTMNYRSYSSYRVIMKILEAKAISFFETHGIEREKKEVGVCERRIIDKPYLDEVKEDKQTFSLVVILFQAIFLFGFFVFLIWLAFYRQNIHEIREFTEQYNLQSSEVLWIKFLMSLNEFSIFLSLIFISVSFILSVTMLMRYSTITSLYASLEGNTSLRENGLMVGATLSLVSLLGSAASIAGVIIAVL